MEGATDGERERGDIVKTIIIINPLCNWLWSRYQLLRFGSID